MKKSHGFDCWDLLLSTSSYNGILRLHGYTYQLATIRGVMVNAALLQCTFAGGRVGLRPALRLLKQEPLLTIQRGHGHVHAFANLHGTLRSLVQTLTLPNALTFSSHAHFVSNIFRTRSERERERERPRGGVGQSSALRR